MEEEECAKKRENTDRFVTEKVLHKCDGSKQGKDTVFTASIKGSGTLLNLGSDGTRSVYMTANRHLSKPLPGLSEMKTMPRLNEGVSYINNVADNGGAFAVVGGANTATSVRPSKRSSTSSNSLTWMEGNSATQGGGSVFVSCYYPRSYNQGTPDLENKDDILIEMESIGVRASSANIKGGGAVYLQGGGSNQTKKCLTTILRGQFQDNEASAPGANGGALNVVGGAHLHMISSAVTSNRAAGGSGAGGSSGTSSPGRNSSGGSGGIFSKPGPCGPPS
jgi:hypothetical protein